jgi:hypothetical protein
MKYSIVLLALLGACTQPVSPQFDLARVQAYCSDMAIIGITDDLEKLIPGGRETFTTSCVAAAKRTWEYRNGR